MSVDPDSALTLLESHLIEELGRLLASVSADGSVDLRETRGTDDPNDVLIALVPGTR